MTRFVVQVKTTRGLRQRHHVRVLSGANRQVLLTSEKYVRRDHAEDLADALRQVLGAGPVEHV